MGRCQEDATHYIQSALQCVPGSEPGGQAKRTSQHHSIANDRPSARSREDNGGGVAKAIRDNLFEPFVSEGKEGGVGLGLTLAHRVAEEHGGSVILVSSIPGETVFLLTFEKRPPGTPLSKISLETGTRRAQQKRSRLPSFLCQGMSNLKRGVTNMFAGSWAKSFFRAVGSAILCGLASLPSAAQTGTDPATNRNEQIEQRLDALVDALDARVGNCRSRVRKFARCNKNSTRSASTPWWPLIRLRLRRRPRENCRIPSRT